MKGFSPNGCPHQPNIQRIKEKSTAFAHGAGLKKL
jgi:hypothetical protein